MRSLGIAAAVLATAPAAAAGALSDGALSPAGWSAQPTALAAWTQAGLEAATAVQVEVNTDPNGTGAGAWLARHAEPVPARDGARLVEVPVGDLEGRHLVRVTARGEGGILASLPLGTLLRDATPPRVTRVSAAHTPSGTTFRWFEEDGVSGLDAARPHALEVNWSPAGDGAGAWLPVPGWSPSADAEQVAHVPGAGLPEGAHLVRASTADRAGNAATTVLGLAYSDHAAPTVENVRVVAPPTAASQAVEIAYRVADPAPGSGVPPDAATSLTDEMGVARHWEGTRGAGEQRIRAYLPGPRTYRLVVRVTDRAGNVGVSAPLVVASPAPAADGAGSGAGDSRSVPAAPYSGARVRVALSGELTTRRGRDVAVRRVAFGGSLVVRGRLIGADGRPLGAVPLEVRRGRRPLARTTSDHTGGFAVPVWPDSSGDLTVVIPLAGGGVAVPRPENGLHVVVRARVTLVASSRSARAGGPPVTFSGRVLPWPGLLGGVPRKRVVLEWRDPLRRSWRPVLNGYAARDGRFRFSWRFGAGGFALPFRVRVPRELGWPLEPALSRTVLVRVG
jgi:hypothetical protein